MRTKAEALANPMAGDRWRIGPGDEYVIRSFAKGYVVDECTKGIDVGQGTLSNPVATWRTFVSDAEYLGNGADNGAK